jgi:hypothetical protein
MSVRGQNASTATSASGPILAPSAKAEPDVAGDAFYHAELRVCSADAGKRDAGPNTCVGGSLG